MEVKALAASVTEVAADAIVVGVFSDQKPSGVAGQIDQASGGLLTQLVERKEIAGKPYELTTLYNVPGVVAPVVLVVGCGEQVKFDRAVAYRAAAAASRSLAAKPRDKVAFYLDAPRTGVDQRAINENGVAGAVVGCQGQDLYRTEKKRTAPAELLWGTNDQSAVDAGRILGESVNLTRRLVNEPPQVIYPETFAERAAAVAKEAGLAIEVWDQPRLEAERCGSLLAVAKGSSRPPRLVILRHHGGQAGAAPLALVGKGVTFDSGGLSLKPTDGMLTMKCDMAGAATVLGAMRAIAGLRLPLNVIGLMGLVENMPGPLAMKLGDVLTARNGRTIEVQNTDAEGRLVLADVLDVATELGAAKIIDLATLTGSCVVALGTDVAGLMTNDQAWCDTIVRAALACGEPAWQLPMFSDYRLVDYREHIKSEVADIRNVGDGRWGGAIAAAKFLEEFVAGKPWTHMDIAGPAFADKPKAWLDAGASGVFVRTLVEVARQWKN
jgi:leucyl aminopeptidase